MKLILIIYLNLLYVKYIGDTSQHVIDTQIY